MDGRESIPGKGNSFLFSWRPDQLRGPPNHISNVYREICPKG
jgi:hypothetical protein